MSCGAVEWVGGEVIGLGRKGWYSGQPDENICVVMLQPCCYYGWHMENGGCTTTQGFICEFK
jgi:hypothetical protein